MTSDNDNQTAPAPATMSGAPSRAHEIKVKQNPDDKDAKADLGSDESMDASDPSSATQPTSPEPVPSSGFPEEENPSE